MTYIKLTLSVSNINLKQTEFLFGVPSPLVFHSLLAKLRLFSGLNIQEGFTITYREYKRFSSFYKVKAPNSNLPNGLVSSSRGYIKVFLVFAIKDFKEADVSKLEAFFKQNRVKGGFVNYVNIEYSSNLKQLKPYGFTQVFYKIDKSDEDLFNYIVLKNTLSTHKKIIVPTIVGKAILGKYPHITKYNKEAFYSESIIGLTEFKFLRKWNKEVFEEVSWKTEKNDIMFLIKTNTGE